MWVGVISAVMNLGWASPDAAIDRGQHFALHWQHGDNLLVFNDTFVEPATN